MAGEIFGKPLYLTLALVIVIVILPLFAAISTVGTAGSAGFISMQTTITQFMPIFGIGIAVGFIMLFIKLVGD